MSVLKERCPNCGGTIILPPNASVVECDYCGATFSLSDLQKIKEAITEGQQTTKGNDCDRGENEYYESALDTSEADEISLGELCKKAEMALESEQWQIANKFNDEILRRDPKFAKAYLYKLLAEQRVFKKEELQNLSKPFDDSDNYRLLIRFADVYLKAEIENYSEAVNAKYKAQTLENQYQALCKQMSIASTETDYQNLANGFHSLGDYKDSKTLSAEYLKKFKSASRQAQAKSKRKKFFTKLIIFGIILAIIGIPILKKASYRGSLFSVEVTDKVNVDYDDYTASFVFKFNIINDSKHNANYLEGYITVSDTEGTVLASGGTWFSGAISAKNSNYHELSFDLDRSASTTQLWNTDFSDLVIKYRITKILFDDGTEKEYTGEDVIVNKP